MNPSVVLDIASNTLWTAMMVMAPVFIVGFVMGIFLSFFQAVFQMQDATISTVPKIIAISLSLLVLGNWILKYLGAFAEKYLGTFYTMIG